VSHYLGLDALQSLVAGGKDNLNFPIPPYVYLLVPAIYSGIPALVTLAIMYPLLVISVAAFVVSTTAICIISIVILGVLAPIFVPLYLFEYTKGYFDSWVKLLISFMLQPMVVVVFILLMFSVYDFGFYGTCKYGHKDFVASGKEIKVTLSTSLVSASVPIDGNRNVRHFFVEENRDSYASDEEFENCRDSLGFMLNNPFQFITDTISSRNSSSTNPLSSLTGGGSGSNPLSALTGGGSGSNPLSALTGGGSGSSAAAPSENVITIKDMPWVDDVSGTEDKKRFNFLEGIKESPGMLFKTVEIIFEKIRKLAVALFTSCFILYLMYNFSASLADFAADVTGGISTGNMGIKAQSIYKVGMLAASAASGAGGGGGSGGSAGAGGGGDSVATSRGGGGGGDNFSAGGGGGAAGAGGGGAGAGGAGGGSAAVAKMAADGVAKLAAKAAPKPGAAAESAAKGQNKDESSANRPASDSARGGVADQPQKPDVQKDEGNK
jgi:type IV secretion system protein VirB6